jgi:hypothetical protein
MTRLKDPSANFSGCAGGHYLSSQVAGIIHAFSCPTSLIQEEAVHYPALAWRPAKRGGFGFGSSDVEHQKLSPITRR